MKKKLILFWIIVAIALSGIFIICKKPTSLGLDLVGGSRLMLEAQESEAIPKITPEVMDSLQYAIEKRVNAMGVGETIVQRVGTKRLLVEIPNIKDTSKAKEFIGKTAELEFKRPIQNSDGSITWQSTGLTGKDLKKSIVGSNPTTGEWTVELEFNMEGAKKFANLTRELTGKQMAIFFNGEEQSAPRVNEAITGGRAQITGGDGGFVSTMAASKQGRAESEDTPAYSAMKAATASTISSGVFPGKTSASSMVRSATAFFPR